MSRILIKLRLMQMRDMLEYHSTLNKIVKRACDLEELPSVWLDRAVKMLEDDLEKEAINRKIDHELTQNLIKESGK